MPDEPVSQFVVLLARYMRGEDITAGKVYAASPKKKKRRPPSQLPPKKKQLYQSPQFTRIDMFGDDDNAE